MKLTILKQRFNVLLILKAKDLNPTLSGFEEENNYLLTYDS
jgi:hypothetical protein